MERMRNCWWGQNKNGNSLMLKTWNSICLPKTIGGLGFRRMEDFNKALFSKLVWHIVSPNSSLWNTLMILKYLKFDNFLHCDHLNQTSSWFWKDLIKSKGIIHKSVSYSICSNSNVLIWTDP